MEDLSVGFRLDRGTVAVTDSVSFDIDEGEVFGLAGESGCGKTITALALLRLLPKPGSVILSGKILFKGIDVLVPASSEAQGFSRQGNQHDFSGAFGGPQPLAAYRQTNA